MHQAHSKGAGDQPRPALAKKEYAMAIFVRRNDLSDKRVHL
jgi:hypothetical protein